jgi:ribosomal protein S18 acetylase RimI-like enzyme
MHCSKKMKEEGVCEMKRLYVKPAFRKNKIGKMLVEELLISAGEKNYKQMRLDTLTKLGPAIHLYENLGFRNISPYYSNPLPGIVYMEKKL